MNQAKVNGEIAVQYPDGFHEIDGSELVAMYNDGYENRWAIRDKERHAILCIQWHRNNALLAKIGDPATVIRSTESKMRKGMKDHNYSLMGFKDSIVCGIEAKSFTHTYTVEGVDQTSEVTVFKHGCVFYTVYSYWRTGDDAVASVLTDIISNLSIS